MQFPSFGEIKFYFALSKSKYTCHWYNYGNITYGCFTYGRYTPDSYTYYRCRYAGVGVADRAGDRVPVKMELIISMTYSSPLFDGL